MGGKPTLQQVRAERHAAIAEKWRALNPAAAAAQQRFTRQARATRKQFSHKVNGTPETHFHASQTRQGALARLFVAGAISIDELARAAEIASVAEAIGRDTAVRTASLEARVDVSRNGGQFYEALGAVRREVAYTRWRAALPTPAPVLALIVEDLGITAVARRFRMRRARAAALLHAALELWATIYGETAKRIDAVELARAQARLN